MPGIALGDRALPHRHGEGADDGADDADGADQQREDDPVDVAGDAHQRQAQDQRGDDGDFVGLEDVRRHTGAVAHVVAHLVGDDGRVARVIFFQALFDLADEVGAHVGGLGVDAAADAHEQRQQRAAEAEAQQRIRRGLAEDDEDGGAAQQAQAVGQHAGDGARAVSNAQRIAVALNLVLAHRGRRHPDVALHGHAHAELADDQGERGAQDEGDGPAKGDRDAGIVAEHLDRFRRRLRDPDAAKQSKDQDADERQNRPELLAQIRIRAFLNGGPDADHGVRALVLAHHIAEEQVGVDQADDGDNQYADDGRDLEWYKIQCTHENFVRPPGEMGWLSFAAQQIGRTGQKNPLAKRKASPFKGHTNGYCKRSILLLSNNLRHIKHPRTRQANSSDTGRVLLTAYPDKAIIAPRC